MFHQPIVLRDLEFCLPHKVCFFHFNASIYAGQKIGIIGQNGVGKSTLLNMVCAAAKTSAVCAHVAQLLEKPCELNGAGRFQHALTEALSAHPDVLCLDEPTNHLDKHNRRALLGMLKRFEGTLLIASHDIELLRTIPNTFWLLKDGEVDVFNGSYDDYQRELQTRRNLIEHRLQTLKQQKKQLHHDLMREQKRAASSKAIGKKHIETRKYPTIVSAAKFGRSQDTSGHKRQQIEHSKRELEDALQHLRLPEVLTPQFHIPPHLSHGVLVSVEDGSCGYEKTILANLHLQISFGQKIALIGDNASGKSTLAKAIAGMLPMRAGSWILPKPSEIAYLDQHYATLDQNKTVLETLWAEVPTWSIADVRQSLNQFLFRKPEEVMAHVSTLSGGEMLRLSLAKIAVKTPHLLILDEVTNNVDLETREHLVQILSAYPGTLLVITHDDDFIEKLGLERIEIKTWITDNTPHKAT